MVGRNALVGLLNDRIMPDGVVRASTLDLPADAIVVGVNDDPRYNGWWIFVESASFDPIAEGQLVPEFDLQITTHLTVLANAPQGPAVPASEGSISVPSLETEVHAVPG